MLKLNNKFHQNAILELEKLNQENIHQFDNSKSPKNGLKDKIDQLTDKLAMKEKTCSFLESQVANLKQSKAKLQHDLESTQENCMALHEISKQRSSSSVEKHFELAVQKYQVKFMKEINRFVGQEIQDNQESVEGMELCCKLEEFRSKIIDYLGSEIAYHE